MKEINYFIFYFTLKFTVNVSSPTFPLGAAQRNLEKSKILFVQLVELDELKYINFIFTYHQPH